MAETGRLQSDGVKPSAVLEKHLSDLFRRQPMLAGFTMRENLELSDVAIQSWPGYVAGEELYQDLAAALGRLAEERPEAIELLRGRTFARAFH